MAVDVFFKKYYSSQNMYKHEQKQNKLITKQTTITAEDATFFPIRLII